MYYEIYNSSSELIERVPMSQWNGKQEAVLAVNAPVADFTLLASQVVKAGQGVCSAWRGANVWQQRPLVISFFCPCWGSYGTAHLAYLKRLYAQIKQAGAELLVLSNQSPSVLALLSKRQSLPFTMAFDEHYALARQFGVYSDTAPLWHLVSGVSEDAYTPAVFVVNTKGRLQFGQADKYLEGAFSSQSIMKAVWQAKSIAFD